MSKYKDQYRLMCELAAQVFTHEELIGADGIHWGQSLDDMVKRGACVIVVLGTLGSLGFDTWDEWYDQWSPQIENAMEKHNDTR